MVLIGVSINLGMESDDEPKSAPSPTSAVYYTVPTGISITGDTSSSLGDVVYNGVPINRIRHINGGLIVSDSLFSNMDGAFKNLVENSGNIQIESNIHVTSMNGAFSQLQNMDGQLVVHNNLQLRTLGNAFPLVPVIINPSASAFQITSNPQLTTLGTSFNSLRQIFGKIYIRDNPLLQNFEALRNLECHGGIRLNNATLYCENCPDWLVTKPVCANFPTAAPSPSPTKSPTSTLSAFERVAVDSLVWGTVGDGVGTVHGKIDIDMNIITGSGTAFPHLVQAGGDVYIRRNNFDTPILRAFPALQEIAGSLKINENINLQLFDESFAKLESIGKQSSTGAGLLIRGLNQNMSLSGTFPLLERIEGYIEIYSSGHIVSGWGDASSKTAFPSLLCHGGLRPPLFASSPNEFCPECPSWFTDLPTCECYDDPNACDESGSGD